MMKKNISYIPMDHALEIWLLEKLLREPPESAYTKALISGIQDMISGEVSSLLLGALEDTEVAIGVHSDELLIGDLEIHPRSRKVLMKGSEISLTPKEFDILYFLAKNRGEVFTKEQIYRAVWEEDYLLDNPNCDSQIRKRFTHFVGKKAMNIEGLSETTLEKFLTLGYLQTFPDIYHLNEHQEEILQLEGFGKKSFERLWNSITSSRNTTFVRFLVSMDIPMVGRTKSRILDTVFHGSLQEFFDAASGEYDFTQLDDFGDTLNQNIHDWFSDENNLILWHELQKELIFEERKEMNTMMKENVFTGCTIVATGKLAHFTRDEINSKIIELGAKAGSSVTKKTNYLICGEKAGSKLTKAQALGIKILSEDEFLEMIA